MQYRDLKTLAVSMLVWTGWGGAVDDAKPIPTFRGYFGRKQILFFLLKNAILKQKLSNSVQYFWFQGQNIKMWPMLSDFSAQNLSHVYGKFGNVQFRDSLWPTLRNDCRFNWFISLHSSNRNADEHQNLCCETCYRPNMNDISKTVYSHNIKKKQWPSSVHRCWRRSSLSGLKFRFLNLRGTEAI